MTTTSTSKEIASSLLRIGAVFLKPNDMFTWASGIKSPIYCDNRLTLSCVKTRSLIRDAFITLIKDKFAHVELIAGVATAGIPQAAIVADHMKLPMVYVRSASKDHGRENLIEGKLEPGTNVVVIEDLISTGGSSLKAVEALQQAGANVLGLAAIFSYQLKQAKDNFSKAKVIYEVLSDYPILIQVALEENKITQADLEILEAWTHSI